MLNRMTQKLGPGLLFAAGAIGTSHLIQTTRGASTYGLAVCWLIVIACILKYPAYRAAVEYSGTTGRTLIDAYQRAGKWLLAPLLIVFLIEGLIAVAGISLVTAGLTNNLLGLAFDDLKLTLAVIAGTAIVLYVGKYRVLEGITKVFVVLFCVLVIVTTALALPELGNIAELATQLPVDEPNFTFYIAFAGWMPTGLGASVTLSVWITAKSTAMGRPVTPSEARLDFHVGYFGTVLLAVGFAIIGTAVLFGSDTVLSQGSTGFAAQLVSVFTQTIGAWTEPLIASAALVVMLSTVISTMDGLARVYSTFTVRLLSTKGSQVDNARYYGEFLALQFAVSCILLLLLMRSFLTFIDIATTTSFLVAPAVAWFNHRALFAADVPEQQQPGQAFRCWSWVGIVLLGALAAAFVALKLAN